MELYAVPEANMYDSAMMFLWRKLKAIELEMDPSCLTNVVLSSASTVEPAQKLKQRNKKA